MDRFEELEQALASGGPETAFDLLIRTARDSHERFRARVMQARHRAGLPLIEVEGGPEVAADKGAAFERDLQDAAREAGGLFLAKGDIPSAWRYFRALGDPAPVAEAIERAAPGDQLDEVIEIALREQVHPRKGFELILEHRGVCNAITWFGAMPAGEGRRECLKLLLRALYDELSASLRSHIERVEGVAPTPASVADLIAGRNWLFEGENYHVDTTHLASALRFSPELEDEPSIRMAMEIAAYGTKLAPVYHYRGDPPFDDPFADHLVYLRALLGDDVEGGVEHFRRKAREGMDAGYGFPADVLVDLLVRVGRVREAIAAALEFSTEDRPSNAPSALQLCQMAGDYGKLRDVARGRGDLLAYAAGAIQDVR